MLIGGGISVVAAVVGGVVVLTGGDDKKSGGEATTTLVTVVETTTLTTVPPSTFVITVPPATIAPVTAPPDTAPPDTGDELQTVTDDNGVFSVLLPGSFQTFTSPITLDSGLTFARIAGSDDLTAYSADEDTFGLYILVGQSAEAGTAAELVNTFDPGRDVCPDITTEIGRPTALGAASVLRLDGCGTGGAYAKVIIGIDIPARGAVLVAVSQGIGPSGDSLVSFTQAVFESVRAV